MDMASIATVLAAGLPEATAYFNPYKIVTVVILTLILAYCLVWVDRDTDRVKTKREQWNMIVLAGALVAYMVLLIPPWRGVLYFAGLAAWLAITSGALLAYVVHRNGRVVPAARVLTAEHFKRLLSREGQKKRGPTKDQRVRIVGHDGKFLERPDGSDACDDFDAVQEFLYETLWRRASDVDMLAGKERYRVVFRIDGVASERGGGLAPDEGERVFRFLKQAAGLNVEEMRKPQKGMIRAALLSANSEPGPTEVYTSGTTAGERLRLHVTTGANLRRIHELGLAPQRLDALQKLLAQPSGLLLVSAPPKQGSTTTQYAILRAHDAYIQNIHTLERRPLTELDTITQRMYDPGADDISYARQLQSTLRREPDIVLVSECEDHETARIATRACREDRKIYMGLNANDCFDALSKYLSFLDDNAIAGTTLLGVVNQRLLRVLCTECRQAYKPDPATLKKLNLPAEKIEHFHRPPTEPILDKKGNEIICPNCQGTGYVGRTGVYELLVVTEPIARLIGEGASINRIKSECRKNRMYYLQEEALLKVIDGTTSMQEVLRSLRENGK
jgi:type II secretory ATPase GspE/PulE/Tfp pilus assembly ATPase PilB-like protein